MTSALNQAKVAVLNLSVRLNKNVDLYCMTFAWLNSKYLNF